MKNQSQSDDTWKPDATKLLVTPLVLVYPVHDVVSSKFVEYYETHGRYEQDILEEQQFCITRDMAHVVVELAGMSFEYRTDGVYMNIKYDRKPTMKTRYYKRTETLDTYLQRVVDWSRVSQGVRVSDLTQLAHGSQRDKICYSTCTAFVEFVLTGNVTVASNMMSTFILEVI